MDDAINPYESPDSLAEAPGRAATPHSPARWAWLGALIGPLSAAVISPGRVGPEHFLWWQGKGGETILTSLGRIVVAGLLIGGSSIGSACGLAIDFWSAGRGRARG